jgi:CheY-like chemotaxis protein
MSKEDGSKQTEILSRPVLLVDDEKDIVVVIKKGLELEGLTVHAFTDPEEAISKFKPGLYGLLIADIRMPRINGFELFHTLTDRDPKLKTCFLSAFEIHENEHRSVFPHSNILCFIRKPITSHALAEKIKKEALIVQ